MSQDARGTPAAGGGNSFSDMMLFWASFLTLIAAGMGFAIRGEIMADWGIQFGFTQTELGEILGMGLVGFGLTIIFFSFFADLIGYGWLMIVAFLFHFGAVAFTLAAPFVFRAGGGKSGAYWCLFIGQLCFSLGNGTCEAVINPLTATLFPKNKTHWLNILHAGWPGGLVLGALVALGLNKVGGVPWEVKWGIILLPMLMYGAMMIGRKFPKSEAKVSGVSVGTMFLTLFAPILLFLFLIHALIGYVELGTDGWIVNITNTVLKNKDWALIAFIWTNVLMFTLRFFAGPIVHKISPLGLLLASAVLGTAGLVLMGMEVSNGIAAWMVAVTIYGIGKTFYWPTMLGVISERYPKGGALALGMSAGIGMLSAGLLGGPGIGFKQDYFAVKEIQALSEPAYQRYVARNDKGEPDAKSFLGLTPKIAGLDNSKVGSLLGDRDKDTGLPVKIQQDVKALEAAKKSMEEDKQLKALYDWWQTEGKPNEDKDKEPVEKAGLNGGKMALLYTAAVPAAMAIGYLLLILVFQMQGGYKQVHIDDEHK